LDKKQYNEVLMSARNGLFVLIFIAGVASMLVGYSVVNAQVAVTLPSAPTGLTATTSDTPKQVTVSWSASTETSGTIEGYYVYRNGANIATTAGTSIVDGDLSPGVYSYTVAAYDANGITSALSSPAGVTLIADTTPPTTPSGVTIAGTTSTNSFYTPVTLTISWNPSSDAIGVAGYYVYRNGISITSSTSAFTGTSITDTVPQGTYTYKIVAYDAAQNISAPSSATVTVVVDTIPPTTPTKVSVQQAGAGSVNITWASSTDPSGLAGYQVFRNGVQIASASVPSYADSGLSTGLTYGYQIAAYDVAGNVSMESSPVSVTILQYNGPGAPYALTATQTGTSSVALTWVESIDPLVITGYTVYRNGTQIATVSSTNYSDTGMLATGTLYSYNVTASDVSGAVSGMSATSSVIISAFAPAPMATLPPPVVTTPAVVASPSTSTPTVTAPSSVLPAITQSLYYGLRNTQVSALQSILVQNGYLASVDATGFYGNLTRNAVEKFQCAENIACTGGAGWGLVGPKTRSALNALSTGTSVSSGSSTALLTAEIQTLEAELANLEKQAQ
jgi:fibronectin type 3 domain-containing protein